MEKFFIEQSNNNKVLIGGVRLLSDFSDELVTVRVKGGEVQTIGRGLKIARFDENEIEITGHIDDVKTSVVSNG